MNLTPTQQDVAVKLLRKAAACRAEQWDNERALEIFLSKIAGEEIEIDINFADLACADATDEDLLSYLP